MAVFRHFSKKLSSFTSKFDSGYVANNHCGLCFRFLSYSPKIYGDDPDPGPVFIKNEVQLLLKTLTRVDLSKVYRTKRLGDKRLEQPVYKFMTDKELQEVMDDMRKKVDNIIQMPPVVSARKPIDKIWCKDLPLQGFDTSNYVFTDITFGLKDSDRIVLIRDTDGILKEADWETRDRVRQIYFPVTHRSLKVPKMFEDQYFEDVLKRKDYIFILDRACLQFEPNDPVYQKIVSITYQQVNDNNEFEVLRSTRHFGPFTFFVAWHKMIDNLLLDLIETDHIDEAKALIELYSQIHKIRIQDDGHLKSIENYINEHSTKKATLELALQAYQNEQKKRKELEEGIKRAHGVS